MIDLKKNYQIMGIVNTTPTLFLMAVATQRSTWPINMRFIY